MKDQNPFEALEGYYASVQQESMPEGLEEKLRRRLKRRPHWVLAPMAACLFTLLFLQVCSSAGPGSTDMTLPGEIRKRQLAETNGIEDPTAGVEVRSQLEKSGREA